MLDLHAERHQAGSQFPELYDHVSKLKSRYELETCRVRPRDSLMIRRESDRELIQELIKRYREFPQEQQAQLPALLNSLAQLEVIIGDFISAQRDFDHVAEMVNDHGDRAEAHYNTYRTAIECRRWAEALAALLRACGLNRESCEPFPLDRYQPESILGAGGFGVSFLCREISTDRQVVVKSLREDTIDRDFNQIFNELQWLKELQHPLILAALDWGFADSDHQRRPYVVYEHFEGQTLISHVKEHGLPDSDDVLALVWPIARALQAMHNRGALHRNLRPNCVLVKRNEGEGLRWQIKLTDCTFSLKRAVLHAQASDIATHLHTSLGRAVAHTLGYVPPELLGRPKGMIWVGPHSDIYAFGKLCWYLLTEHPDFRPDREPAWEHWRPIVEACTEWTLEKRIDRFGGVLGRLAEIPGAGNIIDRIEDEAQAHQLNEYTTKLEENPQDIDALLGRSAVYEQQQKLDEAIEDLGRAIEIDPRNAHLYRRRANLHVRHEDFEPALSDLNRALGLEPGHMETLAQRGYALSRLRRYDDAIRDLDEVLRQNPRDEHALFDRGNAYFCKGEYQKAIEDYGAVIRLDPQNLWAFGNRGKCYMNLGESEKALTELNQLLKLDPVNLKGLQDRGNVYSDLGEHEKAIEDFTKALEVEPQHVGLYIERGLTRANANQHEEAIADFSKALELNPEHALTYMYRGNSYSDLNKIKEAIADMDRALELDTQLALAWYNRGNIHAQIGRHRQAIDDYSRALDLEPNRISALYNRGNSYSELGQYREAIEDYTKALEAVPNDASILNNRGNAYSALGDHETGLKDFQHAIEVDPEDEVALFNRANTFHRLCEFPKAIADYDRVIQLKPDHDRALTYRGNSLLEVDKIDEALADYTQAIEVNEEALRAFNNRGTVYLNRGEVNRALEDFNSALEIYSDYIRALHNRCEAYLALGRLEDAKADCTRIVKIDPDRPRGLYDRGMIHLLQGDLYACLSDLTATLELNPEFLDALRARVDVLLEMKLVDRVIEDCGRLLDLRPREVETYHKRGRAYMLLGDFTKARDDNQSALQIDPENATTLNNLAWIYACSPEEHLRNATAALEHARKACELTNWKHEVYLDTLAAAYASNGMFDEAIEWQTKALELAEENEQSDYQTRLELYQSGQANVDEPRARSVS